MKKIFLLILLVFVSVGVLSACQFEKETWAVYFYVCGSDLESRQGSASKNLQELVPENMPDNLTFVVETGGTGYWQDDRFDPNRLQRWEVTDEGFSMVEERPQASMGASETLAEFLSFCKANYPADHTMLVIWDHGAGTLYGACKDSNFKGDMLTLTEMHDGVSSVFGEEPLDILAFDCCLMATVDVADLFQDSARYLIASEESVPSTGFSYAGILDAVSKNPMIQPEELGKQIVEDFQAKCTEREDFAIRTLSLTDLSKIGAVTEALEQFGGDLVRDLYEYGSIEAVDLALFALGTENYGGNSRAQGYRNLIDLWHFASNLRDYYPSAKGVMDAVEDAVVAEVSGPYRAYSRGLSMYYPYKGQTNEVELFAQYGRSEALKSLYELSVLGKLYEKEAAYVSSLGLDPENPPKIKTFKNITRCDQTVRKNEAGEFVVNFGSDVGECVTNAMVVLYRKTEDGGFILLGSHDDIGYDFESGTFSDQFNGLWLTYGDIPLCSELSLDMDYNVYSIPVQYPGDTGRYALQVIRNKQEGTWEEIGVRAASSEPGKARSEPLPEGKEILFVIPCLDANWNPKAFEKKLITYSADQLHYAPLPDGEYCMRFKIEDIQKNERFSDPASFRVEGGKVIR